MLYLNNCKAETKIHSFSNLLLNKYAVLAIEEFAFLCESHKKTVLWLKKSLTLKQFTEVSSGSNKIKNFQNDKNQKELIEVLNFYRCSYFIYLNVACDLALA